MTKVSKTQTALCCGAIFALCAVVPSGRAQAQAASPPDLSGNYRCQPDPSPCLWSGATASISQSGNKLEIKSEKGDVSNGTLTSDSTISAGATFNSLGEVRPDKSISWSNGTRWQKQ